MSLKYIDSSGNEVTIAGTGQDGQDAAYASVPIGGGIDYFGTEAPEGFLFANGSAISRTTYSELFNVIGTTYGSGDGSTTFNLPDKRERVSVMMKSTGTFNTMGKTGGEETHTLTTSEIPSHEHKLKCRQQWFSADSVTSEYTSIYSWKTSTGGSTSSVYVGNRNDVGATGGGESHNNLQPYMVCNYIIRVSNTSTATTATIKDIEAIKEEIKQSISGDSYPIGSIYMSVSSTNPSSLFGGTWEQIQDTFLLASGSTYEGGATGGEATHTLTKAELPNYTLYSASHGHTASDSGHTHTVSYVNGYGTGSTYGVGYSGIATVQSSGTFNTGSGKANITVNGSTITVNSGGSGTAMNNMPPYLAVYVWKRTA